MADTDLSIRIRADASQATAAFNAASLAASRFASGVTKSMVSTTSGVGLLSKALTGLTAVFITGTVVRGLLDMALAASKANVQLAIAANTAHNLGRAFDEARVGDAIARLATSAAGGGYSIDAMRLATEKFAAAGLNGNQVLSALALTANVAAGSGRDYESATLAISKAVQGSSTALVRLGIVLKDANGHAITGQAAITELARRFHDDAEKRANSLEGQLGRLNNQWTILKEMLGVAIIPLVEKLIQALSDLVGGFEKASPKIKGTTDDLHKTGLAVNETGRAMQEAAFYIGDFVAFLVAGARSILNLFAFLGKGIELWISALVNAFLMLGRVMLDVFDAIPSHGRSLLDLGMAGAAAAGMIKGAFSDISGELGNLKAEIDANFANVGGAFHFTPFTEAGPDNQPALSDLNIPTPAKGTKPPKAQDKIIDVVSSLLPKGLGTSGVDLANSPLPSYIANNITMGLTNSPAIGQNLDKILEQMKRGAAAGELAAKLLQKLAIPGLSVEADKGSGKLSFGFNWVDLLLQVFARTKAFADIMNTVSKIVQVFANVLDSLRPIIDLILRAVIAVVNVFIMLYNAVVSLLRIFGIHMQYLQQINNDLSNLNYPFQKITHDIPTLNELASGNIGPLSPTANSYNSMTSPITSSLNKGFSLVQALLGAILAAILLSHMKMGGLGGILGKVGGLFSGLFGGGAGAGSLAASQDAVSIGFQQAVQSTAGSTGLAAAFQKGISDFSSNIGGIAAGAGAGAGLGMLVGGSAAGSSIGSTIGAIAGSFIPGVGTMIGGLLGGLLGGLFSHKKAAPSDPSMNSNLNTMQQGVSHAMGPLINELAVKSAAVRDNIVNAGNSLAQATRGAAATMQQGIAASVAAMRPILRAGDVNVSSSIGTANINGYADIDKLGRDLAASTERATRIRSYDMTRAAL